MERMRTKRLPPIFKMSVLCNILPYYGHLHRWRRLLEKISTETKNIWDQNKEQLKYIGREFKREIEFDNLKETIEHLRPNRSWLDLFSLSQLYEFDISKFDFTILTDNLSEDEALIINPHDDIFKTYQIYFWSKDSISDIFQAIKCPSFKSETKNFKTSVINEMRKFIDDLDDAKSVVMKNTGEELSINLIYGDTIKITSRTLWSEELTEFFDKLKERFKLWEIGDCACKPKKIRVWVDDFEDLKIASDKLKQISNINDIKLGMEIDDEEYSRSFYIYDKMVFNHSASWMSYESSNFVFWGETLTAVSEGNSYNFRLDERTKESEYSYIKGKI